MGLMTIEEMKQSVKDHIEKNNGGEPWRCRHLSGLNAPVGADCTITIKDDSYLVCCEGREVEIAKSRISDVSYSSEPVYGKTRPSLLGAIFGWEYGALGTIIGSNLLARAHVKGYECTVRIVYDEGTLEFDASRSQKIGSSNVFWRQFVKDFERGVGYAK